MRTRLAAFAVILLASACSSPTPPEPAKPVEQPKPPAPRPQPPVVTPAGSWLDWPLAAGDWVYRQDERGSLALFGPVGQDATVTLRCDRQRQRIFLSIKGSVSGPTMIGTRTSSIALRQFAARPTGGNPDYVAAEIMPRDPGLDALLYSRGRIALEVPGLASIAIPNWAEMSRVVEDCR